MRKLAHISTRNSVSFVIWLAGTLLVFWVFAPVQAQEPREPQVNPITTPVAGTPSYSPEPLSTFRPYPKCFQESWGGDDYCLWGTDEGIEFLRQTAAPQILNIAEGLILQTISGEYFRENFDIQKVSVRGFYQESSKSWTWSTAEIDLIYRQKFNYRIYLDNPESLGTLAGWYSLAPAPPREVGELVDEATVESAARECVGVKDISYSLRNDFTPIAIAEEPIESMPRHIFSINLETGAVRCSLLQTVLDVNDANSESPENVPGAGKCYDCWKDYIPYVAGAIVVLGAALVVVRKRGK